MTSFSDLEVMARTLYGEARGESYEGKIAVGHVIVNRSKRNGYGGPTISGVCRKRLQFSCWNSFDPMLPKINAATVEQLADCIRAAVDVLTGKVADPTNGATHYLNPEATKKIRGGSLPDWADMKKLTVKIGLHWFYKL